jgi:hypothetical protein
MAAAIDSVTLLFVNVDSSIETGISGRSFTMLAGILNVYHHEHQGQAQLHLGGCILGTQQERGRPALQPFMA